MQAAKSAPEAVFQRRRRPELLKWWKVCRRLRGLFAGRAVLLAAAAWPLAAFALAFWRCLLFCSLCLQPWCGCIGAFEHCRVVFGGRQTEELNLFSEPACRRHHGTHLTPAKAPACCRMNNTLPSSAEVRLAGNLRLP